MKKMNRIAALVLALIMCLGMMGTASAAPSDVQITKQGKEESVENGAVKLSKTIAGTETENVFDITLKVTTSENLEESAISPNTAVVLVIDSSSSMIDNEYGDNTRLYAAKESARSFVDSYVNDYQKQVQSDPDLVRKLAVVNFDSTSYTTYKMEQLKADSAAATATAVKAAIGDPSKDVPNTDRYRPNYGTYDGISVHSGTNIEGGMQAAASYMKASRENGELKNVDYLYTILITDGQPGAGSPYDENKQYLAVDIAGGAKINSGASSSDMGQFDYVDTVGEAAQIIKDLSPAVTLSESTLYPILKRMQSAGCIAEYSVEHNGRLRKYYHLTPVGKDRIAEFLSEWSEVQRAYDFIKGEPL